MLFSLKGIPCPGCQKTGLRYANHPHAFGWKDYDHIVCRSCHTQYKTEVVEKYWNKLQGKDDVSK